MRPREALHGIGGAGGLVLVVVTHDRRAHGQSDSGRELAEPSSVLGQHHVGRGEHGAGPGRQVVVVADRRRDDEQHAGVIALSGFADLDREMRVGRAERPHERAVDLGRALRGLRGKRAAAQRGSTAEDETRVATKERRHGRGEGVGVVAARQRHLDLAAQRQERGVVVIAGHAEHACCPARHVGVARELDRLVVRPRDARVATARERHRA